MSNPTTAPGRPFFKLRLGIRQHLILLILLLLLPLLAIEVYSAIQEYQTQREGVLANQAATARSVSRTVTAFVNDQANNNRVLGLLFRNVPTIPSQQRNAVLAEQRQSLPYLHSYQWLDQTGRTISADPPQLIGVDYSQLPAFQRVLTGKEADVSNLLLSPVDGATPVFAIINRVYASDGSLLGILSSNVDVTKLTQVLDIKIGYRQRGSISIHDRGANLVYNSQFPNYPYQNRFNRSTESVKAALEGREMTIDYVKSTLDGLDKMGASVPIALMGWSASVAEPIEDALAPATNIITPRLISFVVVAMLALLGAWLYSRYLAKPLVDLRRAAADFGQGSLDRRANDTTHTVAEVQQLSLSFNTMAERIAQENRARDAFLAQAAHELKTPITVIKSSAQLLMNRQKKALLNRGVSDPVLSIKERETLIKQLAGVDHQSNRMTELINRLLEHTRLQGGRMDYEFVSVNFLSLLQRCLDAATQLTAPERHPISFMLPASSDSEVANQWLVFGDNARIEQVVLNLLENAIKYSPQGGPIEVSLQRHLPGAILDAASLKLTIQDSGLGVAAADLERLFERYYRAQTEGQKISGLGLGLYISQEIIRQHGGRLWASSAGLNQGSTFHLVLPLEQAEKAVTAQALAPSLL